MNDAEAVRVAAALLPAWVGWANLVLPFLIVVVAAALSAWVAGTTALRLVGNSRGDGWAENARILFPVRLALGLNTLVMGLIFGALASEFEGPLSLIHGAIWIWVVLLPAMLVSGLVARRFAVRLGLRAPSRSAWWREAALGLLIFGPYWLVTLTAAGWLLDHPDVPPAPVLVATALALLLSSWGGGLLLARAFGLAKPASQRLEEAVGKTSQRVGIFPRATYEVPLTMANAFAFHGFRLLAFTRGALDVLDDDALEAICFHELGHLGEPWRLARTSQVLPFFGIAAAPTMARTAGLPVFWVLGPAMALAVLSNYGLRRLRRRREERADAVARTQEGEPGGYGRALELLYKANRIPVVLGGRWKTHPDLYDRLAAGATSPLTARPLPPRRSPTVVGLFAGGLVGVVAVAASLWLLERGIDSLRDDSRALWHIALRGGGASELADLALRRQRKSHSEAIALYRGAAALDDYPTYSVLLGMALADADRCDEAEQALSEARLKADTRRLHGGERHALVDAPNALVACRERASSPRSP